VRYEITGIPTVRALEAIISIMLVGFGMIGFFLQKHMLLILLPYKSFFSNIHITPMPSLYFAT
jgi:hypothetical protein